MPYIFDVFEVWLKYDDQYQNLILSHQDRLINPIELISDAVLLKFEDNTFILSIIDYMKGLFTFKIKVGQPKPFFIKKFLFVHIEYDNYLQLNLFMKPLPANIKGAFILKKLIMLSLKYISVFFIGDDLLTLTDDTSQEDYKYQIIYLQTVWNLIVNDV